MAFCVMGAVHDSIWESTGSSLQSRKSPEATSMSDQDDWEFAGPDDAKAEIRAAVGYLLREVLPAAPAVISCRRSLRSCARSRAGCRPSRTIPWMMACPVDKWGRLRPPHVWQASCDRWHRARGKQSRDVPIRIILEHANEYAASFWD